MRGLSGPSAACMLALAGGVGALRLARLRRDARRASLLAIGVRPFEAPGDGSGPALLVVGDSLSVGVGASDPCRSVPGRIAAASPGVAIVNRARSGARLADVPMQLALAPPRHYDAVLMTVGGNDALRRTPRGALARGADRAIAAACRVAPEVVVASNANLGAAPIVPWPLTRLLEARTRTVRDALHGACERYGVRFVDFFRPLRADPFARAPERYFSLDGVHPSDACYELCFRVIEHRTALAARLAQRVHRR